MGKYGKSDYFLEKKGVGMVLAVSLVSSSLTLSSSIEMVSAKYTISILDLLGSMRDLNISISLRSTSICSCFVHIILLDICGTLE
mgnify:CR=1 FL=1